MTNQSILIVGSSNTDMIIKMERIPKPGETIIGGQFLTAAGGKGANQAVGAARAGGDTTFIACVGTDMFGDQALAGFQKDGINIQYIVRDHSTPSGVALIFVGNKGENSIAVASGANGQLSPAHLQKARDAFKQASVLLLQLETPLETVQAAADLASAAGVKIILNPAPARPLPDRLLRRLFLITPNESEAELLTGVAVTDQVSAAKAAQALRQRGARNVIVTMGSRGAWVAGPDGNGLVPAFPVKAIDTTAAGDIFNGTLAVGLAQGQPLMEAARFASAAAAISVTRMGAQTSAPTLMEIERFLAKFNGSSAPVRKQPRKPSRPKPQPV